MSDDFGVAIDHNDERDRASTGAPSEGSGEIPPLPQGFPLLSVGELRLALRRVGVTIDPVATSKTTLIEGESLYLWVMPRTFIAASGATNAAASATRHELDGRIVLYIGSAKTAARTVAETHFSARERFGEAHLFGWVKGKHYPRLEMLSGITPLLSHGAELIRVSLDKNGNVPLDRAMLRDTTAAVAARLADDSARNAAVGNDLRVRFFRKAPKRLPAGVVKRHQLVQQWLMDFPSAGNPWTARSPKLGMLDLERLMIRIAVRQGKLIGNSTHAGQWEGQIYTKLDMLAVLAVEAAALME